tara:strand:+ start:233 stop:1654 length:1422 start_codon:yes stop_codon:yes gene_type:complete
MFFREKFIVDYYLKNFKKKIFILKINNYFFKYLSRSLKFMIDSSSNFLFIGMCQYPFLQKIKFKKINIFEISKNFVEEYKTINQTSEIKNLEGHEIEQNKHYDKILITSLEFEKDPLNLLKEVRKNITNDGRLFIVKYNLWWSPVLKILDFFKLRLQSPYQNVISNSFLNSISEQADFEIIHKEDQMLLPAYIPIVSFVFNKILAKLPILKFFCFINIFVLRPIEKKDNLDNYKISIIIPCKNEELNIKKVVESIPKMGKKVQVLFGDDKSTDNTRNEIKKYVKKSENFEIDLYDGPGLCKSENVYKGFDKADGDLIAILDADSTVNANELTDFFNLLVTKKYDFINGTRFIYPMSSNAMKKFNYIGNILFSYLFSLLLKIRVTDTLCGTKVFYRKDWVKIKKDIGKWGMKDMWGDYDLLIGAKKNFLKIGEKPVYYQDREQGISKMTNVLNNGLRMLVIIFYSFYKLKFKKI